MDDKGAKPADDGDYVKVDVERMDEPSSSSRRFGKRDSERTRPPGPFIMPKAPVASAWACLLVSWYFLTRQVAFSVLAALPFNVAAIVLSLVCVARARPLAGGAALLLSTVGSLAIYIVSLLLYLGGAARH